MIKQGGGGSIINMSSVHEDWPMPGNTAYCLSKGGVRMLTRTAGQELGPHGIRIVNVGPGAVATPINNATMNDPAAMKILDTAIPLGRMAQPYEIRHCGHGRVPGQRCDGGLHQPQSHRRFGWRPTAARTTVNLGRPRKASVLSDARQSSSPGRSKERGQE